MFISTSWPTRGKSDLETYSVFMQGDIAVSYEKAVQPDACYSTEQWQGEDQARRALYSWWEQQQQPVLLNGSLSQPGQLLYKPLRDSNITKEHNKLIKKKYIIKLLLLVWPAERCEQSKAWEYKCSQKQSWRHRLIANHIVTAGCDTQPSPGIWKHQC